MQLDQLVGDAFGRLLWQLLPFLACALAIAFLKAFAPGRRRRKLASKGEAKTPLAPTLAELEYKRKLEGVAGELKVRRLIEHRYAHSLHDIYLPYRNGTTQIDHVVLIGDRIVVVETKNYSGMIFGDLQGRNWSQILAGGNVRMPFLNPIRQNALHVDAVKLAVGGSVEVVNLVAFVGTATFARDMPGGVMELTDLAAFLDSHRGDVGVDPRAMEAWARLCRAAMARPRQEAVENHRNTLARRMPKDRPAA